MALWLVRAGKYGERENLALEEGLVVIGWDEIANLTNPIEARLGAGRRLVSGTI